MKYVIVSDENNEYIAINDLGNSFIWRKGIVLFNEPKMKWFDDIEDAKTELLNILSRIGKGNINRKYWEPTRYASYDICEAKIHRGTSRSGKSYMEVSNGNVISTYEPADTIFGIGLREIVRREV